MRSLIRIGYFIRNRELAAESVDGGFDVSSGYQCVDNLDFIEMGRQFRYKRIRDCVLVHSHVLRRAETWFRARARYLEPWFATRQLSWR